MWVRFGRCGICSLLLIAVAAGGCRDVEPAPDHDRDLADDDAPLMLPGAEWKDAAIASGAAEWVPFRRPTVGAAKGAEPATAPESPEGQPATEGGDPTEAEVREAVADYNDTVAEAEAGDLLDYFIEAQQEAIEPWLAAAVTLTDQLTQVCEALKAGLPAATDRVTRVCEALGATHSPRLLVESLKTSSETEASGTVRWFGESKACRFVAVEDEEGETAWYFELQGLPPYAEKKPVLDAQASVYERILGTVESGQPLSEAVLGELEQVAPQAKPASDKKDDQPAVAEPGAAQPEAESAEPKPEVVEPEPDAVEKEP